MGYWSGVVLAFSTSTPATRRSTRDSGFQRGFAVSTAPADAVENPAAQVQRPVDAARPRAYAAPQTYGAAGYGVHPFLAAARCMADLGYGRWEPCD